MARVRASILGGIDGIITSFAIVAGAHVLGSPRSVHVIGVSSLLADGVSMGIAEYLSSSSERATVDGPDPRALGALCFASFVAGGSVPLAAYASQSLGASALFALAALATLGIGRARAARQPLWVAVVQTTGMGAAAGAVAYGAAQVARRVGG